MENFIIAVFLISMLFLFYDCSNLGEEMTNSSIIYCEKVTELDATIQDTNGYKSNVLDPLLYNQLEPRKFYKKVTVHRKKFYGKSLNSKIKCFVEIKQ